MKSGLKTEGFGRVIKTARPRAVVRFDGFTRRHWSRPYRRSVVYRRIVSIVKVFWVRFSEQVS